MKEDKAYVLRKTLVILTIMLTFITTGILLVSMQVKTVSFNYFGNTKKIKTLSTTVESFLMQNKIYLDEDMTVTPSKDSVIQKNMEIKIETNKVLSKIDVIAMYANYKPVEAKIIETSEEIDFAEETINNPTINRGQTKVSQEGKKGEKVIKYFVKYVGETEIEKIELKAEVKTEPQNRVIEVGTKLVPFVSRNAPAVNVAVDNGFKQYNIKLPVEQQKHVYNMCRTYGVQYELLLAVMYVESGYNPNAIGGGNSYGLCQIHISNFTNLRNKLGVSNFLDPYDNIKAGAYMLAIYMGSGRKMSTDQTTIEVYALNSYNMGEGSYYRNCYSKGIVDRHYSTTVINLRNRLVANGGL